MALPTLNWKKLPVVTTTTTTASVSIVLSQIANMLTGSTYFDGSARNPGTGSAWTLGGTFVTGSNTEAVWFTPPTKTSMSQSVIIAGKNSTGAISGGTPTIMLNEQSFTSNLVYVGVSDKTGTFTNWTGSTPFGTSSGFTGFGAWNFSNLTTLTNTKISIYESQEAILMTLGESSVPTTNGAFLAGAYLDPQTTTVVSGSTDYEDDGRLYGVTKTRYIGEGSVNWLTATDFLSNVISTASGNTRKHVIFTPQSNTTFAATLQRLDGTNFGGTTYLTRGNKFVKQSLICSTTNVQFLGTFRQIVATRNYQNGLVIRDGSNNLVGFTIGPSEAVLNNCVLLTV